MAGGFFETNGLVLVEIIVCDPAIGDCELGNARALFWRHLLQRYFLNTHYFNHAPSMDDEAAIFDSLAAAKKEAGLGLWDAVSASMLNHALTVPEKVSVVNDLGVELASAHARELVPSQLRG